ncbi:EFCC1 [Cervus elaphus hippelaphus]|uniref:EFCC1 n=1 Tax=Cervus elaphus hippelaphus TaxID=46360 RepID=A0A212C9U3_CEREH|nr:EFCC1 [Cervus elaphus hippelaphus]
MSQLQGKLGDCPPWKADSAVLAIRSEGTQLPSSPRASPEPDTKSSEAEDGGTRGPDPPPEGAWGSNSSPASRPPDQARASPGLDEQLFRSVEGQAASDEDDDREKWQEAQRPPAEVTALLSVLSGCGRGCDDRTAKKLMTHFSHLGSANHTRALGELEACVTMLVEQLGGRGVARAGEGPGGGQAALRATGNRMTLPAAHCLSPEGTSGASAVLDTLHRALAGCELLHREPAAPASAGPALTHSCLISC